MSKHTSWHAGGPADLFFTPRDLMDLASFLRQLPPEVPVMWIGLGSNLLVRDGGIRGAVVSHAWRARRAERKSATPSAPKPACPARASPGNASNGAWGRGVLCRHSRHLGRRAGDERRRLGRRDLAPRGRSRSAGPARRAPHAHARRTTRSAIGTCKGPENEWFIGARLEFERKPGVNDDAIRELLGEAQARPSPSASGAAARCSPIRPAITRRG